MGGSTEMGALAGRRIVVPETREIELLAGMLEKHGAAVVRCPLVAILDAADPAPVARLDRALRRRPPDDLILFTGEGLQRLNKLAGTAGLSENVRRGARASPQDHSRAETGAAAARVGPEARPAGRAADHGGDHRRLVQGNARPAAASRCSSIPTRRSDLLDFLRGAGAEVDPVLPYAYASSADAARVLEAIREMAAGRVDLIAFTSSPQLRRLQQVARANQCEDALAEGFAKTKLAAVGPVVAAAIEAAGGTVAIAPPDNFHLRPMVNAIVTALAGTASS